MSAAEEYWTYRASEETPSLQAAIDAGAIRADTTDADWHKLSPGMRREIVRSARKGRS